MSRNKMLGFWHLALFFRGHSEAKSSSEQVVARLLMRQIIKHLSGDLVVRCANNACRRQYGTCRCPDKGGWSGPPRQWQYDLGEGQNPDRQGDWVVSLASLLRLTDDQVRSSGATQVAQRRLILLLEHLRRHGVIRKSDPPTTPGDSALISFDEMVAHFTFRSELAGGLDSVFVARSIVRVLLTTLDGLVGAFCADEECRKPFGECRCLAKGEWREGVWHYELPQSGKVAHQKDWCFSRRDLLSLSPEVLMLVQPGMRRRRLEELIEALRGV